MEIDDFIASALIVAAVVIAARACCRNSAQLPRVDDGPIGLTEAPRNPQPICATVHDPPYFHDTSAVDPDTEPRKDKLHQLADPDVFCVKNSVVNKDERKIYFALRTLNRRNFMVPLDSDRAPREVPEFEVFAQIPLGEIVANENDAVSDWFCRLRPDFVITGRILKPAVVVGCQGPSHQSDDRTVDCDGMKRIIIEKASLRLVEIEEGSVAGGLKSIESALRNVTLFDVA